MVVYEITALKTAKQFVASVSIVNMVTANVITWLYTQEDMRTLVADLTHPINVKLKHGTSKAWFDRVTKPSSELDLSAYFDASTTDSQASKMLDRYKAS